MIPERIKSLFADNRKSYVVGLDIGTEYVKALVAKNMGDHVDVLGVGRVRQRLSDMHSGAIADIAGVAENCEAALAEAEDMAGIGVSRTVIGIAGELVKGETITINAQRDDPENPLEMPELEAMLSQASERAFARAKAQIAWEMGKENVEIRRVNSSISAIHIDGYKVNNPLGFTGKDVAITLFNAYAPLVHLGAIERVADELALDLLTVTAEPFAVARSVMGSDDDFNAICIDVGGGTTDIAVIRDGGIEGTKMFAIGGRSFTRSLGQATNLEFARAEKLKIKFSEDDLDDERSKFVRKILKNDIEVWINGVDLALSEFAEIDQMPQNILLCGGGASLPLIKEALTKTSWYKKLPFTQKPRVTHITPERIMSVKDQTETIEDHTYATAMGLLAVGADITYSEEEDEGVLDKLNKILEA